MFSKVKPRDKCAFKECNVTRFNKGVDHLFRFPTDDKRRQLWIEASGNDSLIKKQKTTITQYGVCPAHFSANSYVNIDQKQLKWNAVPIPYVSNIVQAVKTGSMENAELFNVYDDYEYSFENEPASVNIEASPDIIPQEVEPQKEAVNSTVLEKTQNDDEDNMLFKEMGRLSASNKKLRSDLFRVQAKYVNQRAKVKRLQYHLRRQEHKIKSKMSIDDFLQYVKPPLNPIAETLVRLQFHESKTPFTDDEKDLAEQMYHHCGPALYSRLRQAGCIFPAESTIRNWITARDNHSPSNLQ